ncbi:G3E family GTPase [Herbaspirillum frisingense GSF30]|uniref:G3E family GTPase n=1 Tax=Herbaspirillum frisingense GSF30 TaxID=864073 RepID=A0AAI9N2B1_9BURK|nr:G3E family GTPase [Herbaspirillum frisingense GSF30]
MPPIPVTVVTGFLGAGKTTLLRALVQRRQSRRLALLINEFGEVAIDGDLLRAEGDGQGQVQIQDFAHGLIAYGEDEQFVPAMLALAARRAQIDHVLIETSGLALPSAVMEVLQSPELAPHFVLDATLAVVDTPLLLEEAFASGDAVRDATASLFRQQLECADVVVLNKIDGMDEAPLLQAEATVRALAPNVRFLELAYGARLDIRLALGLRLHQAGATVHHHYTPVGMPGERATVAADQRRFNGHAHSGLGRAQPRAVHPQALPRARPRLAILHAAQHGAAGPGAPAPCRGGRRPGRAHPARQGLRAQRRRPAAAAGRARPRGGCQKRAGQYRQPRWQAQRTGLHRLPSQSQQRRPHPCRAHRCRLDLNESLERTRP